MTLWRYSAVPLDGSGHSGRQLGEMAGDSAAEVRAALRRIGLQVVDLRPLRTETKGQRQGRRARLGLGDVVESVVATRAAWLRGRRRHERAEVYDAIATMLDSGIPLLETFDTLLATRARARRTARRSMLLQVREALRSGASLAQAMETHRTWFEPAEVAIVKAAQHGGTLPGALRTLAESHERRETLGQKMVGALAYPFIVAMVGLGVVVFLSVKTLPTLVQVLDDAGIDAPPLTLRVMAFGRFVAGHWPLLLVAAVMSVAGFAVLRQLRPRLGVETPRWLRGLSPSVFRRIAVARLVLGLAEMLRMGVPLVEALRVLAPTAHGGALGVRLEAAAEGLERGETLADALNDDHFFDAEFRRLLEVGQSAGELDALLERVGHRYSRQANRLIDRLTALLEPCVILTLAVLVGIVVMSAVLPLLRLQEVL